MLQRLGGIMLAALAVVLGIYSGVNSWARWLIAIFAFLALVGVVLMLLPDKKSSAEADKKPSGEARKDTAFIRGDASGSTLDNVYSNADYMVDGNAVKTIFQNVKHRISRRRR